MRQISGLLLAALLISSASAEIHLVRPDGSGDAPTIQAAVDQAAWGDVIELADGVYTGDGNRDVSYQGKPITVRSQSGHPDACIIDVEGTSVEEHRAFDFVWSEGPGSVLEGVTITGGYVEIVDQYPQGLGGGVRVLGPACSPTIRNVVFLENLAYVGGGLGVDQGSPKVTDCVFLRNDAWWGSGGGAFCQSSDVEFTRCDFIENHGHQVGGGVDAGPGTTNLTDCRFLRNTLDYGYGAGLSYWYDAHGEVVGCTFAENHAAEYGAGISVMVQSDATIRTSTFYGNAAAVGGGVYVDDSFDGSWVVLENTIIAFSTQGGSVVSSAGSPATLSCCTLFGNAGGDWVGQIAGQLGQNGNIDLDPLFCDAAGGDFGLLTESPCAPFSEPNPECDLIGAWPVGCAGQDVPESILPVARLSAAPNPFLHATCLSFSTPGRISVHDATGRRIRTLSGDVWDGTDQHGEPVPGGVYLVRLETDTHAISRRVVLVR